MNVVDYIKEEVSRQGHDVDALDGIERVGWMLDAWKYALRRQPNQPDSTDAIALGTMVEAIANADGVRSVDVWVGRHVCPPPERVVDQLNILFLQRDALTPMEFYRSFEMIHPFIDGNGRTGKILLNWLNGTLLDPIFPPDNLWGRPIRNP